MLKSMNSICLSFRIIVFIFPLWNYGECTFEGRRERLEEEELWHKKRKYIYRKGKKTCFTQQNTWSNVGVVARGKLLSLNSNSEYNLLFSKWFRILVILLFLSDYQKMEKKHCWNGGADLCKDCVENVGNHPASPSVCPSVIGTIKQVLWSRSAI